MSESPGFRRQKVDGTKFNKDFAYPYELRRIDFEGAMQDVYDFFHDVNEGLRSRGLERLDDMLRPANMSGIVTDMLTASMGKHSRSLVPNDYHNGHPDLVVKGEYPLNSIKAGENGVEIKCTRKGWSRGYARCPYSDDVRLRLRG